jgi:hypothetical protein
MIGGRGRKSGLLPLRTNPLASRIGAQTASAGTPQNPSSAASSQPRPGLKRPGAAAVRGEPTAAPGSGPHPPHHLPGNCATPEDMARKLSKKPPADASGERPSAPAEGGGHQEGTRAHQGAAVQVQRRNLERCTMQEAPCRCRTGGAGTASAEGKSGGAAEGWRSPPGRCGSSTTPGS